MKRFKIISLTFGNFYLVSRERTKVYRLTLRRFTAIVVRKTQYLPVGTEGVGISFTLQISHITVSSIIVKLFGGI